METDLKTAMEIAATRADTEGPFTPSVIAMAAASSAAPTRATGASPSDRAVGEVLTAQPGGNVLGSSLAGNPAHSISIDVVALVKRYLPKLITPDELKTLRTAGEQFKREQTIRTDHSPAIMIQKTREAANAYALDTSKKNLETLRHSKTLDLQEAGKIQQVAIFRMRKISGDLASLDATLHGRLAAELKAEIAIMTGEREKTYTSFGLSVPADPLITELVRHFNASEQRAKHRTAGLAGGESLDELANAILSLSEK